MKHPHTRLISHELYQSSLNQIKSFIQSKSPFKHIIQIGIGGSELGPMALHEALSTYLPSQASVYFMANIDPESHIKYLKSINLSDALIIVVSKSGTTSETMANYKLIRQYATQQGYSDLKKQTLCVSIPNSPIMDTVDASQYFVMDEAIGGRFSSTSLVGALVLSLAFGVDVFESICEGAAQIDASAKNPNIRENMALMSAALGFWDHSICRIPARCVIAYQSALKSFTEHLQQLECESLGKSHDVNNTALDVPSGPIVIPGIGSNSQHSFFQLLHQGTQSFSVHFIASYDAHLSDLNLKQGSSNHQELLCNAAAQQLALALGNKDQLEHFPGNHPSTLMMLDKLSPKSIGALLAFHEHQVMFHGFFLGINPFDQPGVRLGKSIAQDFLNQTQTDDSINTAILKQFFKS